MMWIVCIAAVAALTALDQFTKTAVGAALADGPYALVPGVFELRYLENRGAAFGILKGQAWFFILIAVAFAAAALAVYGLAPRTKRFLPLRVSIVFLVAGALGNLIDRIALGYVRDFLYVSLIDFPIFNVADIYVTLSAAALLLLILFYYRDEDFTFLKRKTGDE